MRLRLLARLTGLALAGVLLVPTAASATETETIHLDDTLSSLAVNPCSGVRGTQTIDFSSVLHFTAVDNDAFHVTGTLTGTFTFVPEDPSQPTYTGHFTSWFNLIVNSSNSTTTQTLNVVLTGSDGSQLKEHALFRFTRTADGTVTAVIQTDEFTCP
jgi:hypothetical protein